MSTPELRKRYELEDREQTLRQLVREHCEWDEVLGFAMNTQVPTLRRPGGKLDMHCAFHEERTPSLRLWPDGGFHCHGCGTQGDMLDFIRMKLPGITEEEILERLDPSGYRIVERLEGAGHA